MAKVFKFKEREYGVVGLGEIMLRLSSPVNELIIQGDTFEKQIGGSELNVVSGLESLGRRGAIISKIPDNELGRFVKRRVRASGASDDFLIYDDSREKILSYLDILFMSEECFIKMFSLEGTLEEMQREFAKRYDIEVIASTQREVISPKKHNFSSKVYHRSQNYFFTEEKYKNIDVVDRIGSGDAYLSGALYGLLEHNSIEKFVQYGNAMSVVKNTTMGDMAMVDHKLIQSVIHDHNNLGEISELNR